MATISLFYYQTPRKLTLMIDPKQLMMVGIGELLWDYLPSGKQLGGAPANFAFHACQLGNKGIIISCVGDDTEGKEIISALDAKAIGNEIFTCSDFPTGHVTVETDSQGIPSYIIHNDVAWDYLQLTATHHSLAQEADVVCFGTLAQRNPVSRKAIQAFLKQTSDQCIKIFDINLREPFITLETIIPLLHICTILKLNDEELARLAILLNLSGSETELLLTLQNNYRLDLIILTKGADGSRLFKNAETSSELSGQELKVKDTVGAGDSFTASVATGLCLKMPLHKIHNFAENVAHFVCQHHGATPQLPAIHQFL